jgi:hypothetical protein
MNSYKKIFTFVIIAMILLGCSFIGGTFPLQTLSPTKTYYVRKSPTPQPITITPTESISPVENYFGLPYDPRTWQFTPPLRELYPPYLSYVSDPECQFSVNYIGADFYEGTMKVDELQLGNHAWTRTRFWNSNNVLVFEVYNPDGLPDEYYSQAATQTASGGFPPLGGFILMGLYDSCRDVSQELMSNMP